MTIPEIMANLGEFSVDLFNKCIKEIIKISDDIQDGWTLRQSENDQYIVNKNVVKLTDDEIIISLEYHVCYHPSYCVPTLAFNAWRQDGSLLSIEEYWAYNEHLKGSNMYETLTQMDHPVLHRPILLLHPCKTNEIIRPFLEKSNNPVVSWLTVVGPFVHLKLHQIYLKLC